MARELEIATGEMRQTGTFRKNTPVPNGSGGFTDSYTDLLTCRGRLRKIKGNRALEQGATVINKNYEWICRYQSALVVNTGLELVINGQVYRINDWEMVDEIPHWVRFVISVFQ